MYIYITVKHSHDQMTRLFNTSLQLDGISLFMFAFAFNGRKTSRGTSNFCRRAWRIFVLLDQLPQYRRPR